MNNNLKIEITEALRASTIAYVGNNDKVQCAVHNELNFAGDIVTLEHMTTRVIRSTEMLFSVKAEKISKRKYIHPTNLGKAFLNALKIDVCGIKKCYSMHRLNPFVELLIRHVHDRHLDEFVWFSCSFCDEEVVRWVDVLNGCVSALRKEAQGTKFKATLNDFHRSANKNFRELSRYLDAQFEEHSRLLVIRLDLGYQKAHNWPESTETGVGYAEVKVHWKDMLKYLSCKLPDDCFVGFAWKLEFGLEKSFHYHLLLLLDGSKVREDVTIAKLIGEHWRKVITAGKGLYYNCNAFKSGYKICGIGMINHYDTEMREGLKKAALYLTKIDYFIKLLAPGKDRTFGKGNMPKQKVTKKGRPRKLIELPTVKDAGLFI